VIPIAGSVRVWIATGHTDMRKGMHGLALQVQQGLKRDPNAGDLYIFRGRTGSLVKILWHDGANSDGSGPGIPTRSGPAFRC
jgi:transposase